MKKLVLLSLLFYPASLYAVSVSGGVGASVPDNENVESAVIGKVDADWWIGDLLSMGLSVSQTGVFDQQQKPSEVVYAQQNPNAFAGKKFHHDGDVIIIEGDDVTNVFITEAPPILPKAPKDLTERRYWTSEATAKLNFLELVNFAMLYGKVGIGASGVNSYDTESRIGLTESIGGGFTFKVLNFHLGAEAVRRFTQTNVNSYGFWEYVAKGEVRF